MLLIVIALLMKKVTAKTLNYGMTVLEPGQGMYLAHCFKDIDNREPINAYLNVMQCL